MKGKFTINRNDALLVICVLLLFVSSVFVVSDFMQARASAQELTPQAQVIDGDGAVQLWKQECPWRAEVKLTPLGRGLLVECFSYR